jgi:hypothetical protein
MAKTEIKLEIPTGWDDITLKKYLDLQLDLKNFEDDEEAITAALFNHLCGLDPKLISKLSISSYNLLKSKLYNLINPTDVPLTKFVNIGGISYGFEPNLSTMSYGAYADISAYETIKIDKDWAKVMNILYRPITLKAGDVYQIEPYDGDTNWEKWLDVDMGVHFGCWFFFINLQTDLLNGIQNSMNQEQLPPNIKSILARSGKLIQRYSNSQVGISKK